MSQIWNAQFVLSTQHKSDDETRYGGTHRSERCCWGTYEEFSRNSTALRKACALPWIRPCSEMHVSMLFQVTWEGRLHDQAKHEI